MENDLWALSFECSDGYRIRTGTYSWNREATLVEHFNRLLFMDWHADRQEALSARFSIGLVGGSVIWLIVFLFFLTYIARNPDVGAVMNRYTAVLEEARYTVLPYFFR